MPKNGMNAALARLGYQAGDRVVLIHADDLGMCDGTMEAFERLLDAGLVRSGSVMPPCPGFAAAAEWGRRHPEADLGVHLTLTSEWPGLRWKPVSRATPDSGLVDGAGCLNTDPLTVAAQAKPAAVRVELKAQVDRALTAGFRPRHLDTHQLAAMQPPFFPDYLTLGRRLRLPTAVFRGTAADSETIREWEGRGFPVFDRLLIMPHREVPPDPVVAAEALLAAATAGLNCLSIHPAVETRELRQWVPHWQARVANLEAFCSRRLRGFVRQSGMQLITYRDLAQVLPG